VPCPYGFIIHSVGRLCRLGHGSANVPTMICRVYRSRWHIHSHWHYYVAAIQRFWFLSCQYLDDGIVGAVDNVYFVGVIYQ